MFYVAGWRIELGQDAQREPRPYWRAYRGGYQRGAHSPQSLRELCEQAPFEPMRVGEIATGDARRLAPSIPDGSVDLILTDPVYQNLGDYRWLAQTALRVMRPRGVVLAWASVPKAGKAQEIMEEQGLEYVYTLFYTVTAKTYRMHWYNLFCWTTPLMWFQRPGEATKPNKWMPDTYSETIILPHDVLDNTFVSQAATQGPFRWNKNTGVLVRYIERFSKPGELVYDPFTGTGSVPIACRMTDRRFLASEIDPARADEARARLAATPLYMFAESEAT